MAQRDLRHGEGEARERARLRRRSIIVVGLATVGFLLGLFAGRIEADPSGENRGMWPVLSIVFLLTYLAALLFGTVLLKRGQDELERQNNYKAATLAGAVYVILYPSWYLLWKGGYLPEPMHLILFAVFWLALALAGLYHRFR